MAASSTAKCFNTAKALLLCILTMFATQSISAQRHYLPHVHVGIHAGESLANTSFYPATPHKMVNGLMGGISFRYAEERHVGLMAELNVEQRGWQEDYKDYDLTYKRHLTYIELPVLTHIFFGSRVIKGFFNLGPELCYMIGDKIDSNFDYMAAVPAVGTPFEYHHTEQLKMKVTNRFDYGITAGAGVEFIIRKRHCINLEGRYYYGLGNIFPDAKKDTFSASRGSSIIIKLAYLFRIK